MTRTKSVLKVSAPDLKVLRNFPDQGRNEGLTPALGKKFPSDAGLGIGLEINQKHLLPARQWAVLREAIITSLDTVLRGYSMTAQSTQLQHGAGLAL